MEVAYYNEKLAVWEPLVEPVECDSKHRPWEINIQVTHFKIVSFCTISVMLIVSECMLIVICLMLQVQANTDPLPPPSDEEENDQILLPSPKMSITVESTDILQVTMSKTCLDVLSKLGKVRVDGGNTEFLKKSCFNKNYLILDQNNVVVKVLKR